MKISRTTAVRIKNEERILALLTEKGPMKTQDISEALDINHETIKTYMERLFYADAIHKEPTFGEDGRVTKIPAYAVGNSGQTNDQWANARRKITPCVQTGKVQRDWLQAAFFGAPA